MKEEFEEQAKAASKLQDYFMDEDLWISIGGHVLKVLFIILLAVIAVRVGKVMIRRLFKIKFKRLRKDSRREETLLKLLENALAYVVYFSAIIAILSEFFIDLKGVLAGAGVLGLAVGFGAQNLVKDVITGFFIIFEDQFSVGDYVKIGSAEGVVDEIGLRTTKIKAFTGELNILPNGSISQVVNYSVKNSLAIIDVTIPFEAGVDKVETYIRECLADMEKEDDSMVAMPKLVGPQSFTDEAIVERIIAETKPMMQFDVARKMSVGIKKCVSDKGIDIQYPELITKSLNG